MYPAVLLNDCLKRFMPPTSTPARNPKHLAVALAAPYLTYDAPADDPGFTEQEADAIGLMGEDGVLRCPFDRFRFCVQTVKHGQMMGFVERIPGALSLLAFFRRKDGTIGDTFYTAQFRKGNPFGGEAKYEGRFWDRDSFADISSEMVYAAEMRAGSGMEFAGDRDPELRRETIDKLRSDLRLQERRVSQMKGMIAEGEGPLTAIVGSRKDMLAGHAHRKDFFLAYYSIVSVICYEYLSPQNFHAVVRPNTLGKSVEWKKAREHLTIIHRHHAANNAAVAHGSTVDDSKTPTRCAHSRRAHTRLLRSERYRYKIGQRIAVKASWCGPKEWQDSAGQTYQILTPVAP